MLAQGCLERLEVDVAVAILRDRDEIGDGLAPRQLIAVVLEGPDEDDGTLRRGNRGTESITSIEVGRDAQVEDAYQPIDGTGAPTAGEDHAGRVVAVHRVADDATRVLAQTRGLQPRAARLGVGVGVRR